MSGPDGSICAAGLKRLRDLDPDSDDYALSKFLAAVDERMHWHYHARQERRQLRERAELEAEQAAALEERQLADDSGITLRLEWRQVP
jgi:hypothetical protein